MLRPFLIVFALALVMITNAQAAPPVGAGATQTMQAIPQPSPATLNLTGLNNTYTFNASGFSYTSLACDIENMNASSAILTSTKSLDNTNSHPYFFNGYSQTQNNFTSSGAITQSGNYLFDIAGAQFFNLVVTNTGTGIATVQCNPSYAAVVNRTAIIAGSGPVLPVSTPMPVPTVSPGGGVQTTQTCPTTTQTIVSTGGTVYSCVGDTNGNRGVYNGLNSTGPAQWIVTDNPANSCMSPAVAGAPCFVTISTTAMTLLIAGVTNKSIYLTSLAIGNSSGTPVTVQLFEGSGASCSTPIPLPIFYVPAGGNNPWPMGNAAYVTGISGDSICIQSSATVTSIYATATFAIR